MGWDNAGHEPLRPDVVTQKRVDSRGPARVAHGPRCFRARTQGLHTGMPRHADCGGRVVLWLAPPLGHATRSPCPAAPRGLPGRRARNMGCPTAHRTTKGAQPPRRCHWAGRLTSQRRSAAARRRPPPPAAVCYRASRAGPALPACRRDGMAWAGNSWLPRAVGTAASRAERFCGNPNCSIRTPCSQSGEFYSNVTM